MFIKENLEVENVFTEIVKGIKCDAYLDMNRYTFSPFACMNWECIKISKSNYDYTLIRIIASEHNQMFMNVVYYCFRVIKNAPSVLKCLCIAQ